MNFDAFKRELLAHYIRLAEVPAFKAHAWHQVNEFAAEHPSYFGDLPKLLTEAMRKPA